MDTEMHGGQEGSATDGDALPGMEVLTPPVPSSGSSVPSHGQPVGQSAAEKQKAKWRAAKAKQRAKKAGTLPLPSAAVTPPPLPPSDGPGETLADHQDVQTFVEDLPLVDWTPEEIKELTDELIKLLEGMTADKIAKRCEKAHLPDKLIREIQEEGNINPFSRKMFEIYLPKVTAKYLNMAKMSPAYKDEAMLGIGLVFYVYKSFDLDRRLKKIIAAANPLPLDKNNPPRKEATT